MSELSVDIKLNTAQAVQNATKLGDSFVDVSDTLDDVGKDGNTAGDKLESSLESAGREADTAEGKLEDVLQKLVELGRQSGKSNDQIAADFSGAFGVPLDRAKDAVDQVGTRTQSASKLAGDSLSGLGSIAKDVLAGDFQGAASSALGSLGEFAAAAGVGGAVGGIVIEALQGLVDRLVEQWSVYNDAVVETRDELAKSLIEAGGAFDIDESSKRILDFATNTDKVAQAQLIANATGRDAADVMNILAGVTGGADDLLKDWNASWGDLPGNIPLTQIDAAGGAIQGVADAAAGAPSTIALMNDALTRSKDAASDANSKYGTFRDNLFNPLPRPAPVKIGVDTSEIDNAIQRLRNTQLRIAGVITASGGQLIR